jgi:transcription antitermination factor NusG
MDARNFLKIVETPGVVRILGYGNEPTPVPDTEIFSLQAILRENVALDPHPYLQVGERVRIKAGPLKDVVGILLRKHPDKDRLVISVDMLNKAVSIELDSWDIEVY